MRKGPFELQTHFGLNLSGNKVAHPILYNILHYIISSR